MSGFPRHEGRAASLDALSALLPGREDKGLGSAALTSSAGSIVLKEVLSQLDREKSERQAETSSLKTDVQSQQVVLAQIAETLLGGGLQEAIESLRRDFEKQRQQQDLQAAALREALMDLAEHKAALTRQSSELRALVLEGRSELAREISELREASASKPGLELQASLAEELANVTRHSEQQCVELVKSIETERALRETGTERIQRVCEDLQTEFETLQQKMQQLPDPVDAAAVQSAAVMAAQGHAQSAKEAAQEAVLAAEGYARAAEEASQAVTEAAAHAQAAREAAAAADSHAGVAKEAVPSAQSLASDSLKAEVDTHLASLADALAGAEEQLGRFKKDMQEEMEKALTASQADAAAQAKAVADMREMVEGALSAEAAAESAQLAAEAAAASVQKHAAEVSGSISAMSQPSALSTSGEIEEALRVEVAPRLDAFEKQLITCMELGQSTAGRLEDALISINSRDALTASKEALDSSEASRAHLEDMVSTALERTEQLEQSLVAATSGIGVNHELKDEVKQLQERLQETVDSLRCDVNGIKEHLPGDEKLVVLRRDLDELQEQSWTFQARLMDDISRLKKSSQESSSSFEALMAEAKSKSSETQAPSSPSRSSGGQKDGSDVVHSMPAALHGLVELAKPLGPRASRRKALIIGCSYFDSQAPLAGCLNDAWNVLSIMRHTLQFGESQVKFVVDGSARCKMPVDKRPTAAIILDGLRWLVDGAQPGDEVFLYFAGYGTLLPQGTGTFEACLVPVDFAVVDAASMQGSGYRLVPLLEITKALARLPPSCKATVLLDCCHSTVPGIGAPGQPAVFQWAQMQPASFGGAEVSPHDFMPRARRLVLPPARTNSGSQQAVPQVACAVACYSACHQAQWCSELPIEGVMQGAFTWAWVKAMVAGNCEASTPQLTSLLQAKIDELQKTYAWLDQTPHVQLSQQAEQDAGEAQSIERQPPCPQRPLLANQRRKALLVGINYAGSHAQLKGAINDAWNMHAVLRHGLQFESDQIRVLVDGEHGRKSLASEVPTRSNILTNFQWLFEGAQPGDSLILLFCGYGTQHPKEPGSKEYEGYLVPCDFAADMPEDYLLQQQAITPSMTPSAAGTPAGSYVAPPLSMTMKARPEGSYRLVSLLELNRFISQVPAGASVTTILDCSYPVVPGVGPANNLPASFSKVSRGRVDYRKLHDFVSRPRFLELPPLPVTHTSPLLGRPQVFPACKHHCFCACKLAEWDAELPLEGTVQGIFTFAFAKALAAGKFQCSVGQLQKTLGEITAGLKEHFSGVEQTPVLMLSQTASLEDVVLS
eukprot:TRINITY_DN29763_c0_g1_i1.p1 TRINITY_DN29763_c0_g1~~TRINITY_DN29763_c0_g1_i1.p1  ORF type:complete len:1315 (+),score=349.39 TRINITY_DN29763_c0_g1_i1:56-3946(+)